jgi:hypothetical protein
MKKLPLFFLLFSTVASFAQSSFDVSETEAATLNGLKTGYNLISEKEKEVGNKGDFSRFQVEFYITNITSEAKIILYRQGANLFNSDVAGNLVQFKCLNATGARLTSKEITLQAKSCIIQAITDDKDCVSGKTIQNRRPVKIGYWIKPGETISSRTIVIVPLNEKPKVVAILYPDANAPVGTTVNTGFNNTPNNNNNGYNNGYNNNNAPAPIANGFIKLRSLLNNTYLNIEKGPLSCSAIDNGWWSAQWQLVTVSGTNYYHIQNRWKPVFLSLDDNGLLSANNQSDNALWVIETVDGGNSYSIKSAVRNAALMNLNGNIQTTPLLKGQPNIKWSIEQAE